MVVGWLSAQVVPCIDGIAYGLLLFLVAGGLTLSYGTARVLNLAHGTVCAVGAYTTGVLCHGTWPSLAVAVVAGTAAGAACGTVLAALLAPGPARGELRQALLTMGVALVGGDLLSTATGGTTLTVTLPAAVAGTVNTAGHRYPTYRLALIVVALLVATGGYLALSRTRIGRLIRAAVDDPEMVACLGISTTRVRTTVLTVSGALAGMAGVVGAPVPSSRRSASARHRPWASARSLTGSRPISCPGRRSPRWSSVSASPRGGEGLHGGSRSAAVRHEDRASRTGRTTRCHRSSGHAAGRRPVAGQRLPGDAAEPCPRRRAARGQRRPARRLGWAGQPGTGGPIRRWRLHRRRIGPHRNRRRRGTGGRRRAGRRRVRRGDRRGPRPCPRRDLPAGDVAAWGVDRDGRRHRDPADRWHRRAGRDPAGAGGVGHLAAGRRPRRLPLRPGRHRRPDRRHAWCAAGPRRAAADRLPRQRNPYGRLGSPGRPVPLHRHCRRRIPRWRPPVL